MLPENVLINAPSYDPLSCFGIGGLSVIIAIVWVMVMARRNVKNVITLSVWVIIVMALSAALASTSVLVNFKIFPPPMAMMIFGVLVLAFVIGFSPFGKDSAVNLSFATLIGLQTFRLPLELMMHHAGKLEIMPQQLSYSGYNFDIITGAVALLIFILLLTKKEIPKALIWIWNVWGTFCLIAILVIAITTSPMVRLFGDEPKNLNTWVLFFPYIWLPVVLVTIAISGHVIIWRKLLIKNKEI